MTEENVYKVLASRVDEATDALIKLALRCAKYGDKLTWTTSSPYEVETKHHYHKSTFTSYVDIIVDGMAPTAGDYTFIGKIVTEHGAVLVDMVPFETRPEGDIDSESCEHCNVNRRRTTVFLVRENETGDVKQVGRTCLRDHMGIDTPSHTLAKFKMIKHLDAMLSDNSGGSGGVIIESVYEILKVSSAAIKIVGWLPKYKQDEDNIPTAYTVLEALDAKTKCPEAKRTRNELKANPEEHAVHAEAVLEWLREDGHTGDYMTNLQEMARVGTVDMYKRTPIIASAVASYDRHMNQLKERELLVLSSDHIGTPKERLKAVSLDFVSEYVYNSDYGVIYFMKFVDDAGNIVVWKTSAPIEHPEDTIVCDFTVKEHADYKDVKQTNILRLKVKG